MSSPAHARFSILTLLAMIVVLAMAGCVAREYSIETSHEVDEPDRAALAAAGQYNCVAEAATPDGATEECPIEWTGGTPAEGILILDDVYATFAPPNRERTEEILKQWAADAQQKPTTLGGSSDILAPAKDAQGGGNPHRSTDGHFPNVILPGVGTFWAGLGWWNDLDGDGNVAVSAALGPAVDPASEFVPLLDARIYSWVDPGAHPTHASFVTPERLMPDFTYHVQQTLYKAGGTPVEGIVFIDGSLLQAIRVTTASDPILTPSDGGLPFTPGPRSRIDVDDYATLAPPPASALYRETIADTMNRQGSPSFGWCPGQCGSPFLTNVDSVDGPLVAVYDLVHPRYPPEWADGSGSSAAGRRDEFTSDFHGWIDVVPGSRTPGPTSYNQRLPVSQSTLVAPNADGWSGDDSRLTVGPGWMSYDVWIGVWRDISGDGFVGSTADGEPYAGGTRPGGHDYLRPSGEFIGAWPVEQAGSNGFDVWLVPDTNWGAGAYVFSNGAGPNGWGANSGPACNEPTLRVENLCLKNGFQGTEPIRMPSWIDRGYGVDGYYRSQDTVFFPEGSPGFTICSPTFTVRFSAGGIVVDEPVHDCDHLERYEGI